MAKTGSAKLALALKEALSLDWPKALSGVERRLLEWVLRNTYDKGKTEIQVSHRQIGLGQPEIGLVGMDMAPANVTRSMKHLRLLGLIVAHEDDAEGRADMGHTLQPVPAAILELGDPKNRRSTAEALTYRKAISAGKPFLSVVPHAVRQSPLRPSGARVVGPRMIATSPFLIQGNLALTEPEFQYEYDEDLNPILPEQGEENHHRGSGLAALDPPADARGRVRAWLGEIDHEASARACGPGTKPGLTEVEVEESAFENGLRGQIALAFSAPVDGKVIRPAGFQRSRFVLYRAPEPIDTRPPLPRFRPNVITRALDRAANAKVKRMPLKAKPVAERKAPVAKVAKPAPSMTAETALRRAKVPVTPTTPKVHRPGTEVGAKATWKAAYEGAFAGEPSVPPVLWNPKTSGQVRNVQKALGNAYGDFLTWLFGDWDRVVTVHFHWMTTNPPPAYPTVGFVSSQLNRLTEARAEVGKGSWDRRFQETRERPSRPSAPVLVVDNGPGVREELEARFAECRRRAEEAKARERQAAREPVVPHPVWGHLTGEALEAAQIEYYTRDKGK